MTEVTVTRELEPARGRYVARLPGSADEAVLTFQRVNPELIVADARREGFKIRPVCPFVAELFDRRPDWADLRA
jgi:hypothetical protein